MRGLLLTRCCTPVDGYVALGNGIGTPQRLDMLLTRTSKASHIASDIAW